VTVVGLEIKPLVPVTVTMYVPRGVNGVVVTVRVDEAEPCCVSETLVGFTAVVTVGLLGLTELDSWTVPVNPLLASEMVDDPEFPAEMIKDDGDALIEKFGAA
jgi:hypothetical protein